LSDTHSRRGGRARVGGRRCRYMRQASGFFCLCRFESLILSHHSRFTCECKNEDDNDGGRPRVGDLRRSRYKGLRISVRELGTLSRANGA